MESNITHLTVVCDGCKNKLIFPVDEAATYACQSCGCNTGVITAYDGETKGMTCFSCSSCKEEFYVFRGGSVTLGCPKCGCSVIIPSSKIVLSRISRETIDIRSFVKVDPKVFVGEVGDEASLKIAIPYFDAEGKTGKRIERAVKTWIIPEVVWILTDQGVVPPGWGVCRQIFTERNTLKENLHPTKTKPFLTDILKKMLEVFPNEEYYGFFNTDIILPPGMPVRNLLPNSKKAIVFHHRLELVNGRSHFKIRDFSRGNQTVCGKDGFIATKKAIEMIIDRIPELVIGAPVWDDGMVLLCWEYFGRDSVELRYGDIWHVNHNNDWTPYEPDAQYNRSQILNTGMSTNVLHFTKWGEVQDQEERRNKLTKKRRPVLGIVQPGRLGDVNYVLPIAKWYYDKGYKVIWPVCNEFLDLFDYVHYVDVIGCGNLHGSYQRSLDMLKGYNPDLTLDLGIGFGRDESDWISSKLHFNEWKYKESKVPFEERHELQITRDFRKENALWSLMRNKYSINGGGFNVIHDTGTKGPFKFKEEGVRIEPIQGYTIYDWIGIMEKAKHLYCVDSCISNLADQLKICEGDRTVWFWQDIPDREPRKALGFPKLSGDWKVLE